jgi:SRSO17 transposase
LATAADIARTQLSSEWKRLSAGAGTKGLLLHDCCYLALADLEGEEFTSANQGLWTRGLLIRRPIADGDLAFCTTWCEAEHPAKRWLRSQANRGAIADSFETAKNQFGLDHNESRSWHGWHRHIFLVMLAFTMMAAICHRTHLPPSKNRPPDHGKNHSTAMPSLIRWSIQQVRRIAIRLARKRTQPCPYHHMATLAQGSPGGRSAARSSKQKGNSSARVPPIVDNL